MPWHRNGATCFEQGMMRRVYGGGNNSLSPARIMNDCGRLATMFLPMFAMAENGIHGRLLAPTIPFQLLLVDLKARKGYRLARTDLGSARA